ncbi:hypothetical protein ACOMHN_037297 [Nucella lapillus]
MAAQGVEIWTMSTHLLLYAIFLTLTVSDACSAQPQDLRLVVNGQAGKVSLRHFWQSTGFCPPLPHQSAEQFDLSADMEQNLAYIGAVPHRGIQQVRIHWLLDLVKVQRFSSGWLVYNFTFLDGMVELLHTNSLHPGFELMGNPSGLFTDMENKTQIYWWRDLTRQVAQRYINRYGLKYVKQWNFETWNEPDCHDFDGLKMTVQGFLNYYDACSEGLKAASPLLVLGGPGDGCDQTLRRLSGVGRGSAYREALFHHVVNGTNYFTGKRGVRLDYISLHRKGAGEASTILDEELKSMSDIRRRFPQLSNTPFYNDEADPLVGWSKPERWRATAAYAAMAVKVICQHQNILLAPNYPAINYTLLSNDNGFLSFHPHHFTQRTLLARFQMNQTGDSLLLAGTSGIKTRNNNNNNNSKVKYVTFVRKPIYAAMVLLSKLGDRQVFSALLDQTTLRPLRNTSYAGSMATVHTPSSTPSSDSLQWAAVVYSSSDTALPTTWGRLCFQWRIPTVNATDLMLAIYSINEKTSNPYFWWSGVFGKPDFPTLKQFEIMRKNEGPFRHSLRAASSDRTGKVEIRPLELREPHVLLFHLCHKSLSPPEQVTGLRIVNITAGQILILWSDATIHTKCIKTFEVDQLGRGWGTFRRINTEDTIVNLFVYATDMESQVQGQYRVRAVDYWGRPGPYSPITTYPSTRR